MLPLPGDRPQHSRLTERLGLALPMTAENLLGQKRLQIFETAGSFDRLGFSPVPLDRLPWASSPRSV